MFTNRLAREKSPYLLQHAHNPVDWYPWGEEAFAEARRLDKPIFLSIGYSTCHWCHVMERESFEDPATAAVLNRHFVSIKVDREERPDVDRVYMLFVQAATGSGGWPMSVWLTPDLRPFYGGTYFPPDARYGRPAFRDVLQRIAEAWRRDRDAIVASSRDVLEELARQTALPGAAAPPGAAFLESAFHQFRRAFDPVHGGFGGAPKFPQPSILRFLLREHARTGNAEALNMALRTLDAMARGGIHDHLGGGFHRYSVDAAWRVPHFEKMLYDQAQLAAAYIEAYQVTGEERLAAVARGILDYVAGEMTSPEGGFYSAEDADSAADSDQPEAKREGAFYLWTLPEIEAVLGPEETRRFALAYGAVEQGTGAGEPHGEFAGKNILFAAADDAAELAAARRALAAARSRRPRPHLDDKIVTAWNGLMISAFALAAQALGDARYLDAARRAASFLLAAMWNPEQGILFRRFRQGEASIAGLAEDYAFLAQGLLDLYETCFDERFRETAERLAAHMIELFEDRAHGGLFAGSERDPHLVLHLKDADDGAEPSSNSVAALTLLRLASSTGRQDFRAAAGRILDAFGGILATVPSRLPYMLMAVGFHLGRPKQIVISGEAGDAATEALVRTVHRRFLPHKAVLSGTEPRWPRRGGAAAYVCENFTCREPAITVEQLRALLE
jgi:uncharacterized protein YyaL (SSP411 family)